MKLIALTGGIGSGKSVVAHLLQVMGYGVYDCDSRAKALMLQDTEVRRLLVQQFGEETYLSDGSLNRQHLSEVAFADDASRQQLNAIVHPATACDIQRWSAEQSELGATVAFIETALLRTARLDMVVDAVWHVTAPDEVRIQRVIARNGFTAQHVQARMAAQRDEDRLVEGEHEIVNDGVAALLPQVINLLNALDNDD